MCFGYHKYTHLFWSTDKLGIYRKYTVVCMQKIIIENNSLLKSGKALIVPSYA